MMRWLHFASIVTVFGGAVFGLAIGPATPGLQRIAAIIAGLTGVAWLAGTMAYAMGGFDALLDPEVVRVFLVDTSFGTPIVVRLLLFVVLLGLSVAPHRALGLPTLGVSALLLISQGWLGHAAEGGATPLGAAMLACYGIHLLAGAAWLGGLPALSVAIARRGPADSMAMLDRFSILGTVVVTLVILSGIANAAFHIGDAAALATSAYGRILAVKMVLVGAMVALAARNRFVIMPRLRADGYDGRLRTSLALELALGLGVLAAAALLGITPPPR